MSSRSVWIASVAALLAVVVAAAALLGPDLLGPAVSAGDDLDLVPVATDAPTEADPTRTDAPTAPSSPTPDPTTTEEATDAATEQATEDAPEPDHDVAAVQARLRELRYYVGAVDGEAGAATTSAVMAFQKVNGLGVDGVIGPNTLAALEDPVTPQLRSGPATRIEVDLTRQVAYLVRGGQLARIMPVSSGSGKTYTTSSGGTARSLTPVGWFEVERRIVGVRRAPLGVLYDPLYFYRGWALHGSNSVPAYPASHGCVRLTRADARWLAGQVPNGTPVHLYGGTHTFTAGSSAPGTDTPAGDTTDPTPEPTDEPTPTPTPTPEPTPEPTAEPTPTPSTRPTTDPSTEPTATETATEPTATETATAEPTPGESTDGPGTTASEGASTSG